MTAALAISFKIEKAEVTGRYVSGWLSVVEKDGKRVEDTQGDLIAMEELRKGMHGYMAGERIIKAHHKGEQIGRMIEMVIVDDDFVKAVGATTTKRGAWGTAEITDENVQKSVREKRFSGFSMGGGGKRTKIEKSGFAPLVERDGDDVEKMRGVPRLGGKGMIPKGQGPKRRAAFNAQDNKVHWGSRAFRTRNWAFSPSGKYRALRQKFARVEDRLWRAHDAKRKK